MTPIVPGFKRGNWTVLEAAAPDERHTKKEYRERWLCACRCGTKAAHSTYRLIYDMTERSACRPCSARMAGERRRANAGA